MARINMLVRSSNQQPNRRLWLVILAAVGLGALMGLVYLGNARGNAPLAQAAPPERSPSAAPAESEAIDSGSAPHQAAAREQPNGPDLAAGGSSAAAAGLHTCRGLRVLDVESNPDGSLSGAWLADDTTGPTLVLLGDRFGEATLTRVSEGADRQMPQVWMNRADGPCRSSIQAEDKQPASMIAAQTAMRSSAGESPDAGGRRIQASDLPAIRRMAGYLEKM
jgi:hypothetical protein